MKKYATYILGIGLSLGILASCSREALPGTQSGEVKVLCTVDGAPMASSGTKAADNKFAVNDVLLAYFQHIDGSDAVVTDFNALKTLKVTSVAGVSPFTASLTCTDASGLFWDDFSSNTTAGKDIRETGHGLRTLYAVCYNGGTPSTALTAATGELGWTVASDQTSSTAMSHSDLLWSQTITKVAYAHSTAKDGDHNTITLPFSHAMSKVTMDVELGDGFPTTPDFDHNVTVTLKNGTNQFYTVCTASASDGVLSAKTTAADIKMKLGASVSTKERTFEAIVVPSTLAAEAATFATIRAYGNDYIVPVTADMRLTTAGKWGSKLTTDVMQSGVNYKLKVRVDKAKVVVEAYLADWENVSTSDMLGKIVFDPGIVSNEGIAGTAITATGANFNLFKGANQAGIEGMTVTTPSTVCTYDGTDWTYSKQLYWENADDDSYFRALSAYHDTKTLDVPVSPAISTSMAQAGTDLMWGTTSAHTGKDAADDPTAYTEGQIIEPREGRVPMTFYHAMSKVTFILETEGAPESAVTPIVLPGETSWVDVLNATIDISDLYKTATLNLFTGEATSPGGMPASHAAAISGTCTAYVDAGTKLQGTTSIANLLVIPQTIGDDAKVTVTLDNGAVYKLQLNTCTESVSPNPAITEWEMGKHYTYYIKITKEDIQLAAYIKNWDDKTGSGKADLDWD